MHNCSMHNGLNYLEGGTNFLEISRNFRSNKVGIFRLNFPPVGPFALISLIFRHFTAVSLDKFWTYFIIFVILLYFSDTFFGLFLVILGPFRSIFNLFHFFKLPKIVRNFCKMTHCALN